MVIATDGPVPVELMDQIVASDGFLAGRAISL